MIEKRKLAKDMRNYLSRNERIYWGVAGEHVESQLYLFFSFLWVSEWGYLDNTQHLRCLALWHETVKFLEFLTRTVKNSL